jgi:hypothetical protein
MANNDNQGQPVPLTKAQVDAECAARATRCLEMLVAPDERMFFEQAWQRWRLVELATNEVFGNEQATVEQTVTAIEVRASWLRYWSKYHHKPRERHRCLDAWLNTYEVLEQHERRNANGYPVNS